MAYSIYAVLAVVTMTLLLSIIFYLYHTREIISFRFIATTFILLSMMASMFNSLTYYILNQKSFLNSVIAINISMEVMLIAIISLGYIGSQNKFVYSYKYDIIVTLLVVWNEISMAIFLYSLIYPPPVLRSNYIIEMLSGGLGFYYFIIPMLTEMLFLITIIPDRIKRIKMLVLFISSLSPPTLFENGPWVSELALILIFLMMISIFLLFWFGFIKKNHNKPFFKEYSVVLLILVLMFISTVFGLSDTLGFYTSWLFYGLITIISMIYYFYLAAERRE